MKILICLDYSQHTQKVLDAAKIILGTRVPYPEISVLHVIDTTLIAETSNGSDVAFEELKKEAGNVYKLAKQYLGEGMMYIEEDGAPQAVISRMIESTQYDLLILGTRGRSVVASIFLGSIAEHLLHHSKIPLLIVP